MHVSAYSIGYLIYLNQMAWNNTTLIYLSVIAQLASIQR